MMLCICTSACINITIESKCYQKKQGLYLLRDIEWDVDEYLFRYRYEEMRDIKRNAVTLLVMLHKVYIVFF